MAKKNKDWIYYIAGFLIIFGVSGLIYGLLQYPFIIGSVSVIIGFILTIILVAKKRKRRK
jgi:hypothetical protein